MSAKDASRVGLLVQMAGETTGVEFVSCLLAWVIDIGGGGRLRVFRTPPVARFARVALPAFMLVALKRTVGRLEECAKNFFVAGLTRVGTGVTGFRRSRSDCGGRSED